MCWPKTIGGQEEQKDGIQECSSLRLCGKTGKVLTPVKRSRGYASIALSLLWIPGRHIQDTLSCLFKCRPAATREKPNTSKWTDGGSVTIPSYKLMV